MPRSIYLLNNVTVPSLCIFILISVLSVSGDMAGHSNLYLEGGNASKAASYFQCLVQYIAQNGCLVTICFMNDSMENPFAALLWGDNINMVPDTTGFHQAFTSWHWV